MKGILKHDPQLLKRLVPDFAMGCRRMGPAEGFLESIVEGRTELAEGDITEFTPTGLRTSLGEDIDVDIIICATGFDVSFRPYFPIIGRGGVSLAEQWSGDANAYFALAAPGFPNFMCE
jgi:cation diffusion facilitator CzcD-associated flavoprotein CzcO